MWRHHSRSYHDYKLPVNMEAQQYERRVWDGARVRGKYRITEMWFSALAPDAFDLTPVRDVAEYESGCKEHKRCFGHMCSTQSGAVLAPQSMSMKTNEISTEYHRASRRAFAGENDEYVRMIQSTNYTKNGTMRSILSTPVAGSARLIATPHQGNPRELYISRNLASRLRVCRRVYCADGSENSTYVECSVNEYDQVYVDRPPALNLFSAPPFTLRYWDHDCAGLSPDAFSAMHGDFDGDEVQIYPVYEREAILEHGLWSVPGHVPFSSARRVVTDDSAFASCTDLHPYHMNVPGSMEFIEYTTLGCSQILHSPPILTLGEHTRNKHSLIQGTHDRFTDPDTEKNFVRESIRGMSDICRQQLSQPKLGDMTRIAKVAASCFCRPAEGGLHVVTRSGLLLLDGDGICDSGFPSVRAISWICAAAQQAALDSHRATAAQSSSHDFISDLILGCERDDLRTGTWDYTFVEFDGAAEDQLHRISTLWKYRSGSSIHCLLKPMVLKIELAQYVMGAYNSRVLALTGDRGLAVCRRGIQTICNYYNISLTSVEHHDISHVFSYKPESSKHPVTSRPGILARSLGWIETLEATDYTKLRGMAECKESPHTPTAAAFMSNFDNLKAKHDSYVR